MSTQSPFQFYNPQPQEDYAGAYSRWNNNIPSQDIPSYLDPEDPRIAAYRNALAQPSGAGELVSEYTNSMPRMEGYNPSGWQRATGAALGLLNGMQGGRNPYETAANYVEAPYRRAVTDWKGEGQFIDDRARLLEADKNREMRAAEFSMRQANDTARRKGGLDQSRVSQVVNAAGQDTRDRNADASREQSAKIAEERAGVARDRLGLEQDRLNLSRERYENPKYKPTAPPDVTDRAREMESGNKITDQAKNDVISHPTFKQYFDIVDDTVTLKPDTPPQIRDSIQKFIEARIKNYKLGLSPDSRGGF